METPNGKQKQIGVTLAPELREKVEDRARRLGLSVSAYVRMKLVQATEQDTEYTT